jgi:hypothetical protein
LVFDRWPSARVGYFARPLGFGRLGLTNPAGLAKPPGFGALGLKTFAG